MHITSAHQTIDDRIFHKECRSLAAHGFAVTVVGPGQGSESIAGVRIAWACPSLGGGRLRRMSATVWRLLIRC